MKNRNDKKIPMKEAISLHFWAAKTWWKVDKKLFWSTGLYALVKALTPYVTIWLSAQLINELAGQKNPEQLCYWVLMTLGITAVLNLLIAILHHWKASVHSVEFFEEERICAEKMMQMDYAAVESPETEKLELEMKKHMMGNVYGFIKIHSYILESLVGGVASILGAVTLTVSLFSQAVPEGSAWAVLNHPLISACVVAFLVLGVMLSPLLEGKGTEQNACLWPYINQNNRVLSSYGFVGRNNKRAMDIRLYNQQDVMTYAVEGSDTFQKGSPAVKIMCMDIAKYNVASSVTSVILTGVVYLFVCLKAWAGAFGIGSVTQYVGAVTQLCGGLTEILGVVGQLSFNAEYLRNIRAFLEIPNDMYQGSLPTEKRDDREYEVEFRDVSFRYPRAETWALRHVNMKFRVGSRLAVVGMNGSGKSTFIKLLCRLYDPTEGQILLNGIDIRKYKYDDYMDVFSVVFQDFALASLPLGQNIATDVTYDRDRAEECLRKAGFGEKLDNLEKGLDTYLDKELDIGGVNLSGGEAQKVAIARALYKDAPFIILDEPTAALDPIAEAEIYSKFNEIAGDKTAVYISHRLSSCKFCDEIAVFHEGAVIQQGTHESLLQQKDGKYYELWHAQAQYYTD